MKSNIQKSINFTYTIQREFEGIILPVLINNEEIIACKETKLMCGEKHIHKFLAFKKDFDNVKENKHIPILEYRLYKTDIEKYINKTTYSNVDLEKLENMIIKDVFSFLTNNEYGNGNKLYVVFSI